MHSFISCAGFGGAGTEDAHVPDGATRVTNGERGEKQIEMATRIRFPYKSRELKPQDPPPTVVDSENLDFSEKVIRFRTPMYPWIPPEAWKPSIR